MPDPPCVQPQMEPIPANRGIVALYATDTLFLHGSPRSTGLGFRSSRRHAVSHLQITKSNIIASALKVLLAVAAA
jgi:hypothetical protein